MGSAWVDTTSVYGPAFTIASEPLAARRGRLRCGLCLDVQGAGRRRGSRLGSARRSPRPPAGVRDRVRRLESAPRGAPGRRRAQRRLGRSSDPGGAGALGVPSPAGSGRDVGARDRGQVGADSLSRAAGRRGARDRQGHRPPRVRGRRGGGRGRGDRALRRRLAARDPAARRERGARDELRDSSPAGATRASGDRWRSVSPSPRSSPATPGSSARPAAAAPGSASPPASCSSRRPTSRSGTSPGRCLSPQPTRTRPRPAACLVLCLYLLPQTIPV